MINSHNSSIKESNDLFELHQLALEENNKTVINDTLLNIKKLNKKIKKNEIKCFLSNDADSMDSYLEIHAGAGGTESQDWAEMLRRMYMKWASSKNYRTKLISEHKGDEA